MDTDIKINKFKTVEEQKISRNSDYEDRRISYFIISYYFVQILNLTTKTIFPIPKNLYPKVSMLFGIILVIFFVFTILTVLKKSLIHFICSELFIISIFAISYLMDNAELSLLLNNAVWALFICVPLGVYAYSIKNKEIFYNIFLKSSFVMVFILSFIFFFPSEGSYYNMSFSYALLVPTIFHLNEWFKNRKKIYLLISLIEITGIMVYGSRGALMSLAFFVILKFILSEKNLIRKMGIIFLALIICSVLYFNFDKIGTILLSYLAEKGYYSRSLTLLFSHRISYDSGRFEIFKYYFDLIAQKPFLGWGVLGGWVKKGSGPHNMIIEIMLAFGVISGSVITFILVLLHFRVFFVKDKSIRDLLAIYMSICIVLFFVSGDFLQNPNFFIFLGLVLGSFKNKIINKCLCKNKERN